MKLGIITFLFLYWTCQTVFLSPITLLTSKNNHGSCFPRTVSNWWRCKYQSYGYGSCFPRTVSNWWRCKYQSYGYGGYIHEGTYKNRNNDDSSIENDWQSVLIERREMLWIGTYYTWTDADDVKWILYPTYFKNHFRVFGTGAGESYIGLARFTTNGVYGPKNNFFEISGYVQEGSYENHMYDGTSIKNDWHYVKITRSGSVYKWTNKAGVSWTLYPTSNPDVLRVGKDSPYYEKYKHRTAVFNAKGVTGPFNEFYNFSVDKIVCPIGDNITYILLENEWRTKEEVTKMNNGDKRNAIITEVNKITGHTIRDLQSRPNTRALGSLTALANIAIILKNYNIKSSSELKKMSYEELRNTLVAKIEEHFSTNIDPSLNDKQIAASFCLRGLVWDYAVGKHIETTITKRHFQTLSDDPESGNVDLFHYMNQKKFLKVDKDGRIEMSTDPNRARDGPAVYFTEYPPTNKTKKEMAVHHYGKKRGHQMVGRVAYYSKHSIPRDQVVQTKNPERDDGRNVWVLKRELDFNEFPPTSKGKYESYLETARLKKVIRKNFDEDPHTPSGYDEHIGDPNTLNRPEDEYQPWEAPSSTVPNAKGLDTFETIQVADNTKFNTVQPSEGYAKTLFRGTGIPAVVGGILAALGIAAAA